MPAIAVLKVGQSAVNDGLKATLKSTGDGPGDLDGQSTFMIVVTYENVGTEPASFFIRDWQVEDESGVRARLVGDVNLGIGEVAPGATLAGTVYFSSDTKAARVVYEPTPGHALAVWNLH